MTVMGSDTEYLPDEITYGFVADRVLLAIGDTTGDDDRFPDGVPAKGTVKFSPERTILYTQQTPATVLPQDIECTIYHRDHPVAVNNGYEPELVGKLVDPAGHVGNVALIVGWYEAVYRLETGTAQRFRFKVLPEHTTDDPLWLPSVAPLTPTPSERFVVNEQVYNDTKEARDEAVDAAGTAVQARTGAETAETNAGTHATSSATSASTAADILAATQALGITVDTSVGTRVFVGDTMIHGDTGWRNYGASLIGDAPGASRAPFVCRMKREGSKVTLFMHANMTAMPEARVEGFFPEGFKPHETSITADFNVITGTLRPTMKLTFDSSGDLILESEGGRGIQRIEETFTTNDPWPTSLPGSPA